MRNYARVVPLAFTAALLAGCGDDTGTNTGTDDFIDDPGDDAPEESELRCQEEGYACSILDVDRDVRLRIDSIGTASVEMLQEGATLPEIAEEVESIDGVEEVFSDEAVLFFRLENAPPVAVFGPDATSEPPDGELDPVGTREGTAETRASSALARDADRAVVGDDPEEKSALVLSPYRDEFGSWDEGPEIVQILENTRGYEGNVDFADHTSISPAHWSGWDAYDVVHVATHGAQRCVAEVCQTAISTGIGENQGWGEGGGGGSEGVSLLFRRDQNDDVTNVEFMLTGDYFRLNSGGGDDTIVSFGACESTNAGDLQNTFGQDGTFLGWNGVVESSAAFEAAIQFYTHLSDTGLPSEAGYDEVVASGNHLDSDGTELQWTAPTNDLRIREVVEMRDPLAGDEVENGDDYAFLGAPGDGVRDTLPVLIHVDGVEDDAADFAVHLSVDGDDISDGGWSLPEGEQIDEHTWALTREPELPFDADADQEVEFHVRVELPEGGESQQRRTVRLEPPELRLAFSSQIESEYVLSDGSTTTMSMSVDADFTLTFDDVDAAYRGEGLLEYLEITSDGTDLRTVCTIEDPDLVAETVLLEGMEQATRGTELVMHFRDVQPIECADFALPEGVPANPYPATFELLHFDEVDASYGGPPLRFAILDWQHPDEAHTAARRTYSRTEHPSTEITHIENTTIEIRRVPGSP